MFNLRLTRMPFVAALVAAAALAGGCASGPDVRGDYDRAADFGKYKTYNFLSTTSGNPAEFQSITQQMMQQAAARKLRCRATASKARRWPAWMGRERRWVWE